MELFVIWISLMGAAALGWSLVVFYNISVHIRNISRRTRDILILLDRIDQRQQQS